MLGQRCRLQQKAALLRLLDQFIIQHSRERELALSLSKGRPRHTGESASLTCEWSDLSPNPFYYFVGAVLSSSHLFRPKNRGRCGGNRRDWRMGHQ